MKEKHDKELKEAEKELRASILNKDSVKLIGLHIKQVILIAKRNGYTEAMEDARGIINNPE